MPQMMSFISRRRSELAIDFGTSNLRLIRRDEGIVFDEPSLCCFSDLDRVPILTAAGTAAWAMIDRTPRQLDVRRPLRRGVLQDIRTATHLLKYAIDRAGGRHRLAATRAVIGVPADATQAERQALLTMAGDVGLRSARLVSEPFVAALGAELPVDAPCGSMIVECGAGTTEVAVISLGGICITRSVRIGGASLDQGIIDHLHLRHKFLIGQQSAEQLKKDYIRGKLGQPTTIQIRGRSLATGLPAILEISSRDLDNVVEKHVGQITDVIRDVLNATSPELSRDIHTHGIVLTGGGALMAALRELIEHDTGLPTRVANDPTRCVAHGLHRILSH